MVSDRSDVRSPCVVRADMDNRSRTTSFDQNLVVVTHDCVIGGYTSGVLSPDVWVLVMVYVYGSTAKHACYDITDHESDEDLEHDHLLLYHPKIPKNGPNNPMGRAMFEV